MKYNPKPDGVYRRAGSNRRPKTIVIPLGIVRFKTWKVKNHITGETITPILYILQAPRRKYTRQVNAECAELTSKLAATLKRQGYREASRFITRNSRLPVTSDELALKVICIPYTTNRIERLMGEIAKGCKHQWAHWSQKGLKNTLTFIPIHYTAQPYTKSTGKPISIKAQSNLQYSQRRSSSQLNSTQSFLYMELKYR